MTDRGNKIVITPSNAGAAPSNAGAARTSVAGSAMQQLLNENAKLKQEIQRLSTQQEVKQSN
eukprot:CAMPEP_0113951006 /NCGR_PEP_ID=MMETSP1339-20121228/83722_1 /TAXON_ID=94617 /ORGANISM="Fibrocapsa japonica" /LENGTH=61 /DNA_ID=CAMNT_0000959069 /DNA_START=16 /DNA_END=201 /DNA_ORIENTATION=+ /assembly_acc=CAM_ASM_000762